MPCIILRVGLPSQGLRRRRSPACGQAHAGAGHGCQSVRPLDLVPGPHPLQRGTAVLHAHLLKEAKLMNTSALGKAATASGVLHSTRHVSSPPSAPCCWPSRLPPAHSCNLLDLQQNAVSSQPAHINKTPACAGDCLAQGHERIRTWHPACCSRGPCTLPLSTPRQHSLS